MSVLGRMIYLFTSQFIKFKETPFKKSSQRKTPENFILIWTWSNERFWADSNANGIDLDEKNILYIWEGSSGTNCDTVF